MNIGYACLTVGVSGTNIRSCTLKNATPDVLLEIIDANLSALERVIEYNAKNGIRIFRISSDIIPFGSHPANNLKWWEIFDARLKRLGSKAIEEGIRLSMHPGQYTVINSPSDDVVARAIADLQYHTRFLDGLGLGKEHKIILHIGGVYKDKESAINRFIERYRLLDESVKRRLVIENDDRYFTISDVLRIGNSLGVPVVFDNLHHSINPDNGNTEIEWIEECRKTWQMSDGRQKIHYSQQDIGKRSGSHSSTIDVAAFLEFYELIKKCDIDVMVEVKDKNLSAMKCINATSSPMIVRLEKEWALYKYLVLEKSPQTYNAIRELLKDKSGYPVVGFYRLIDFAMNCTLKKENAINAAQHVWGYFKDTADEETRKKFAKTMAKLGSSATTAMVKRFLRELSERQNNQYLLDSLYFYQSGSTE